VKPAPFDLHRPTGLEEALTLLALHAETAKVIAGGQSLVPLMNLRMATPAILIDLGRIECLRGIALEGDRLVLGATLRQAQLLRDPLIAAHAPLLRAAARHIGHVQTRSRGTLGGSVAHADPAAELPVALIALDAMLTLRSGRGTRQLRARNFFEGALQTALAPDEILCSISVACAPAGTRAAFREMARRQGDFAFAAAAVQRDGRTGAVAAAIGGVLPAPHLCTGLEAAMAAGFDRPRIEAAMIAELTALGPMTDIYASGAYRARLAAILLAEALEEVLAHG